MKNENINLENLKGQKVGVLGLGEENAALANFLCKHNVEVVVCDKRSKEELGEYYEKVKDLPVQFRLGAHYLENLKDFKTIFRTPGLPYLHPKIQEAKKAGVEVSSQTKLFFDLCPCPIVGVTGTKGKGTTATLISEILERKSKIQNPKSKIYTGGNIGTPPISFLDKLKKEDTIVLELSSFQLQDLEKSPRIAVVLDIKIDHLDYHKNREEYIEAKQNIVKFQSKNDFAVLNADYETSRQFEKLTSAQVFWFSRQKMMEKGAFVKDNEFILKTQEKNFSICKTNEVMLKGEHNFENICAAIIASYLSGADIDSIKNVVKSFKGLEHRLEFVKEVKGIKFYNDSFSTNPDTTIAAVKSFAEPIILLVGGSEKNADYSELGKIISSSSVKAVISIGLTGKKIINAVQNPHIEIVEGIQTMDGAVDAAFCLAKAGEIVLLSPASASFDHFKNYKERGNLFRQKVLTL